MKGKYFFLDGKQEVEIQEFDYDYVRNSFLKVFKKNDTSPKDYYFEVVVKRTIGANGQPIFDVRTLDLSKIYFDNTNLRMLDMMKDEIYWGPALVPINMPLPPLKQEYEDIKAGKTVVYPTVVENPEIPAPVVLVRKELDENDPRLVMLSNMNHDFSLTTMVSLDWIENFEICNQDLTASIQQLSAEQLALVKVMKSSSDYIRGIFNNLSSVLESLFPIKPSMMKRWFGNTKFIVDETNIDEIVRKLEEAVAVDTNRFSGINPMFDALQAKIDAIKLNVEHGVLGCQLVVDTETDPFEFEMRHERLMKVRASSGITEISLIDIHRRFLVNYSKLNEIQTVLIPLLITRLQTQASKEVDEETVDIIKNLAQVEKD